MNKLISDKDRWENTAATFEDDVLSVFKADKNGVIKKHVLPHGGKNKTAIDFGAGIGRGLPLIAPLFKSVIATDISAKCLETAKELGYKNVSYKVADLASKKMDFPKADFVLCTNVAISGNPKRNYHIIDNALSLVKKGGTAVFVLPSHESSSISSWRLIQMHRMEGTEVSDIPETDTLHLSPAAQAKLKQGVILTADNPTQHYLFNELFHLFTKPGLELKAIEQVQYDWKTEFTDTPKWMRDPYPWDWLVEVKKVK